MQNSRRPRKRLVDDFHDFAGQGAGNDQRTAGRFGLADIFAEVHRHLQAHVSHHLMDQQAFCRRCSCRRQKPEESVEMPTFLTRFM